MKKKLVSRILSSLLVVAMTFVPMMCSATFKNIKPAKAGILEKVQEVYGNILAKVLKWKVVVVLVAVVFFAGSFALCLSKGFTYFPSMQGNQISVTLGFDKETEFADVKENSDKAVERIKDIKGISEVGAMAGGGSMMMSSGSNSASSEVTMYLILDEEEKINTQTLEEEIYNKTADLPCEVEVSMDMMDMSALGGSGLSIQIRGKDLDE